MFVRCRGTHFSLNDEEFFAEGVNSYFLGFCSDGIRRATLERARELGANTVRSWAFLDVAGQAPGQPAFQYLQGSDIRQNDGPEGLERLDHLISTAEELNLRLILPFVNYWPDFGGMQMYLTWLGLPSTDPAEFYRNRRARNAFKTWMEHVLTRRNTLSGRYYCDEPAVLAWELANEPRCLTNGGRELLLDWIGEMSEFVKRTDPNHLLSSGDEGFFQRSGRSHLYDGNYGVDFEAILRLSTLDFGTFHMYPQHWGEADDPEFPQTWIEKHIEAGNRADKPVVLEEFGVWLRDGFEATEEWRQDLYSQWVQNVRHGGGAGALVWMLGNNSPETAGFRDKFTFFGFSQT